MASALTTIDDFVDVNIHEVGSMCIQCLECLAFCYRRKKSTICCYNGKTASEHVSHPIVHPMLNELFMGMTPNSREFFKSIRKYNQAFAFTSMRSKFQSNKAERRGVYTFRVNRELCHHIGSLEPESQDGAKFAQIYFLDDGLQTNRRMEIFDDLQRETVNIIQEVLGSINALVQGFKSSRDVLSRGHNIRLRISGEVPSGEYPRRYNRPIVPEVDVVVLDEQHLDSDGDIILHQRDGNLLRIKESIQLMMLYPILYCFQMDDVDGHQLLKQILK